MTHMVKMVCQFGDWEKKVSTIGLMESMAAMTEFDEHEAAEHPDGGAHVEFVSLED